MRDLCGFVATTSPGQRFLLCSHVDPGWSCVDWPPQQGSQRDVQLHGLVTMVIIRRIISLSPFVIPAGRAGCGHVLPGAGDSRDRHLLSLSSLGTRCSHHCGAFLGSPKEKRIQVPGVGCEGSTGMEQLMGTQRRNLLPNCWIPTGKLLLYSTYPCKGQGCGAAFRDVRLSFARLCFRNACPKVKEP